MRKGQRLIDQVGNTPLVRLERCCADLPGISIWLKLEFLNLSGSVKDRAALNIIVEGERSGKLVAGKTILDATSGNTGIAYATIGAAKGYPVKLCLPANASEERKLILRALGAELVLTDAGEGSDGAFRKVRELNAKSPRGISTPINTTTTQTGRRISDDRSRDSAQTEGRLTHFVTMLGTTGSFTGTSRCLQREVAEVECWSAQPSTPLHGIEGTKHLPSSIVPGIYDPKIATGNLWIETRSATRWRGDWRAKKGYSSGSRPPAMWWLRGNLASSWLPKGGKRSS